MARPRLPELTNWYASFARSTHPAFVFVTASHSFMSRPWPGSNGLPTPDATKAATRSFGSFTTSVPCAKSAKSLPFAFGGNDAT